MTLSRILGSHLRDCGQKFETTNEIAENVFLYYNTHALIAVLRVHVVYILLCANESVVHNGARSIYNEAQGFCRKSPDRYSVRWG